MACGQECNGARVKHRVALTSLFITLDVIPGGTISFRSQLLGSARGITTMTHYPQQSRPWEYGHATDNRAVASFFNTVYAWMAVGLAITGLVGWFVAHSSLIHTVYASRGTYTVLALAAFGLAW